MRLSNAPPALAVAPPTALIAPPPPPPRAFLQGCSHVRICQECRRIQNLRPVNYTPPLQSSAMTSRISPNPPAPHPNPRLHYHYHRGSMSLPRLPQHAPPAAAERADSDGGTANSPRRSNPNLCRRPDPCLPPKPHLHGPAGVT
ncbi:hypothetical protein WMY93_003231 [Mugilogobius chulae]|uniref:Uncharacterized protein n=1 Tax=Mugilogobius chulae TaxID=88201 RepID=A0AAW0Q498_9GOBI